MPIRQTGQFQCKDETGRVYTVLEYTNFRVYDDTSGSHQEAAGMKDYRLGDGTEIKTINAETFQIFQTNAIIRKIG